MIYQPRDTCRSCGDFLHTIFSLGMQRLTAWTDTPTEDGPSAPLELVYCGNCTLVQLAHTTDPDILFKNADYGYISGGNRTMRENLISLRQAIGRKIDLSGSGVVVDIGSNDGTLLRAYPRDLRRVGYDPVRKFMIKGNLEIDFFINDYFSAKDYPLDTRATVVTAIAMFYDLESPNTFLQDVAQILDEDGLFVIQVSYLPLTLLQNDFLTICHEHLAYYSLSSLSYLLEQNGLHIFDAEVNDVNGGSLRVYVDKGKRSESFMLHAFRGWEEKLQLNSLETYYDFDRRIQSLRTQLQQAMDIDATVYGYAASTKGNVLLQYCGFGPDDIIAIADRNPDKWGKYCAGSNIPVISEDEARDAQPDYFLVLAWAFMDEFRQREKEWHDNGGRFIVPLPTVRIE